MSDHILENYIERYRSGLLTPHEALELQALLDEAGNAGKLDLLMQSQQAEWEASTLQFPEVTARVSNAIQRQIAGERLPAKRQSRIALLPVWLRYTAAAMIVLLGAFFLWTNVGKHTPQLADNKKVQRKDIAPGKDGAVLTLADGRQVLLDSVTNGIIATQGGAQVVMQNGQLAYAQPATTTGNATVFNTMSTPKGRQFHMVLPDGSHVWLNAASVLRFPAVFNGNERVVELTGEAYFEIAQQAATPFKVKTGKATQVDVLGTSFNINAYDNEEAVVTTLVTGSVMVSANNQRKKLAPGEQVSVRTNGAPEWNAGADLSQATAWKNGYFDFNNAGLQRMMRQLERWYDIEITYEGQIPDVVFKGKMDRNVPLSAVLHFLKMSGVTTKLEERNLYIYDQ